MNQATTTQRPSREEIIPLLRIINAKLDRLLAESGNREEHLDGSLEDGFLIEPKC